MTTYNKQQARKLSHLISKLSAGELSSYIDFKTYHPHLSTDALIEHLEGFLHDKQQESNRGK